jgi:hypothetical protein
MQQDIVDLSLTRPPQKRTRQIISNCGMRGPNDTVDKIAGVKKITENLSNTAEELERRFAHDLSVTAISSCRTESKSEVRVCVSSGKN